MHKLSANQLQYIKLAREFTEREMGQTSAISKVSAKVLLEKLRALGLINIRIPEQYGGLGLKTIDACIIAEEFAAGDSGIAASIEASELASTILFCFASASQKDHLLKNLAETNNFAGLALACETKVEALTLQAVQSQDDFVLDGKSHAVINAHIADWIVVVAQFAHPENSRPDRAANNWGAFIIPIGATTSLPGIRIANSNNYLGKEAADIALVEFNNVTVAKTNRLQVTDNLKALWQAISYQNYPIIAAGCVGVARSAMHHAISYAKQRWAFGQPIANHQAVSFLLADMAKDIEAARLLTWQAARAADQGATDPILSNSCKAFAQEMVIKVTTEAVQILGAYGYCREYPTEKLMRDAALSQLLCGNSEELKGELGKTLLS